MAGQKNFFGRKQQRQTDAAERNAEHNALSLEDRLLKLTFTPGESAKEKARLEAQIKRRDAAPSPAPKAKKNAPAKSDKKALKARAKKQK